MVTSEAPYELSSIHAEPLLTEEERALASGETESEGRSDQDEELKDHPELAESYEQNAFQPFDDLPDEERNILTVRAIVVGILCGGLVNASNIYIGLKSGWTASANIFASIVGFTVLKSSAKYAEHIPLLGGDFGPRENNIVQTTATAAGGMSNVFVSAFPAMYQLGLLDTPLKDFWRITTLTAVGGYFGFFFATPLRKFFIIYVARELRLIFPSSSATAFTIRSMHLALESHSSTAQHRMKALSFAFAYALITRVVSQYAVGILWDWHPFTWIFVLGNHSNLAMSIESWGWFVEWSPAFIGSGMLVGLNVAMSYFIGSVLVWGIMGPVLVAQGAAFGTAVSDDRTWSAYISYFSLSDQFTTANHPSPRYWLLWPGVLCLIIVSLTELACQWRIFWLTGRAVWRGISNGFRPLYSLSTAETRAQNISETQYLVEDPAPPEDSVKFWMWLPGLIFVLALTCIVMRFQYDMPIGETCLALLLAFFFSFVAILATGATDITPLTAASKASQIILGSATKGHGWTIEKAQRLNLLGGALASIGANQAADLTGDFRVGFLLRTSPKLQWFAQGIGTLCAIFIAPGIFVLFATAYPCINDVNAENCAFHVPSVSAWRAVAIAVTDPTFPIPTSSRNFAIGLAAFGIIMVLARHCVWTGRQEWVRRYHPNMMVVALAFIIPASVYGTAMLVGASVASIWARKNPKSFEMYGYAVAAGFMAGEGIGGVINAVLQIVGIAGDVYGTQAGCPANIC